MTPKLNTLMLVGSDTTPEMAELSELYANGAVQALADVADITVLRREPDGSWSLPASLDARDLQRAHRYSLSAVMQILGARNFDIGLPQMFCEWGMTTGRALFELLDVPILGNSPLAMGLTADKTLARAVASEAGLNVPAGCTVSPGQYTAADLACLRGLPDYPLIVKPAKSDNSDGLSLVERADDLPRALTHAFNCGSDALIEAFIPPGRELRVAVIREGDDWRALPPEEYPVGGNSRPIRSKADKLARDPDGSLKLAAKTQDAAWIVSEDDPVVPALQAAAIRAADALGCRHYGLFDFRVDDDGTPWFLEAGLYCSFSSQSVVVMMAEAAGISVSALFTRLAEQARGATPTRPSAATLSRGKIYA